MAAIVRVTDETTVDELIECMSYRPRADWDAHRETIIDTLWREVQARRALNSVA